MHSFKKATEQISRSTKYFHRLEADTKGFGPSYLHLVSETTALMLISSPLVQSSQGERMKSKGRDLFSLCLLFLFNLYYKSNLFEPFSSLDTMHYLYCLHVSVFLSNDT